MILIRHGQSEFNAVYSVQRVDPGIPDPRLTELGRAQAAEAAAALAGQDVRRLIASPYTRALETAEIIAERLGLPIEIDPLVRERAAFACDIGSAPADLQLRFPALRFDHLDHPWWHDHVGLGTPETEQALLVRCESFRQRMAPEPHWDHVCVVTHWGFIRGLTGQTVPNCTMVRVARQLPL
jgi:broad specificity phosphatase PhoE